MSARKQVLALLRRHGWNATSFQVLEGGFEYWFEADACVAFVDTGTAWVAAGAPIAAEERLRDVARSFLAAARSSKRSACFFATEPRFARATEFEHLAIGEQPVWDPRDWEAVLREKRSLREQLRRARAKGVRVRRVLPEEWAAAYGAHLRSSLEELIAGWLGARRLPPMGFLVSIDPFEFASERRSFIAEVDDGARVRLVGFAGVVPVYARNGWFLEDLIRDPSAPNGTTELLIDAAMKDAAEQGSEYFTLGLAPLAGNVAPVLSLVRRWATPLYDFRGLQAFKAKLRPQRWAPIHLSYPRGKPAIGAICESLRAFTNHGLIRYGAGALLRGRTPVRTALTPGRRAGALALPAPRLPALETSERARDDVRRILDRRRSHG